MRTKQEIRNSIKTKLSSELSRCEDNYARMKLQCDHLPLNVLDQEYGNSGQTYLELLKRYESSFQKSKEELEYFNSLKG